MDAVQRTRLGCAQAFDAGIRRDVGKASIARGRTGLQALGFRELVDIHFRFQKLFDRDGAVGD